MVVTSNVEAPAIDVQNALAATAAQLKVLNRKMYLTRLNDLQERAFRRLDPFVIIVRTACPSRQAIPGRWLADRQ
ncbi:hypothetical protein ACVOMS_27805 [Bradyrhizobium guangxiense]